MVSGAGGCKVQSAEYRVLVVGRIRRRRRRRGDIRIKVDSSVGKLAELPFLLELGGLLSVLEFIKKSVKSVLTLVVLNAQSSSPKAIFVFRSFRGYRARDGEEAGEKTKKKKSKHT